MVGQKLLKPRLEMVHLHFKWCKFKRKFIRWKHQSSNKTNTRSCDTSCWSRGWKGFSHTFNMINWLEDYRVATEKGYAASGEFHPMGYTPFIGVGTHAQTWQLNFTRYSIESTQRSHLLMLELGYRSTGCGIFVCTTDHDWATFLCAQHELCKKVKLRNSGWGGRSWFISTFQLWATANKYCNLQKCSWKVGLRKVLSLVVQLRWCQFCPRLLKLELIGKLSSFPSCFREAKPFNWFKLKLIDIE